MEDENRNNEHDRIEEVEISKEIREDFLDYSMSVIVQRALPDVRDGLKPVHRRILHAMNQLGITSNVAHKKSARIVGEVIGKYHPHGDVAVYDAMVRMAQDFAYRYPLVDGHGNFGSLDGDEAAAMRYTEARMSKIATEMLRDINKDTVDFVENYDGEETEPTVLPSRIPNLLINGSVGIAVGMATNIPPHNLGETIQAIFAVMDNPDITVPELMNYIKGPDFPTGGIILGRKGIRKAYETGRGSIMVRSKYHVNELSNGKKQIIFYEIPYAVNKSKLIEKMAELIRNKEINGVTYLNDESNREGIRIVMELRKDAQEDVILNQLFRLTPLQSSFGINMLALENGRPRQLPLKDIINDYIDFQVEVIVRKTKFELKKAQDRAHILEGFRIALDRLDEVIQTIRSSHKDEAGLNAELCEKFGFDTIQAKAILAMQLRRLSGLERDKIEREYQELLLKIADYKDILANHDRVLKIIRDDLTEINEKYGDERRTEITDAYVDMDDEDLIPKEDVIVMLTMSGYIKRTPVDTYRTQNRGGRGIKSLTLNEDDAIDTMLSMNTHDILLLFTDKGRVFRIKGYNVPNASRTSKGIPVVNLISLNKEENVTTLLSIPQDSDFKTLLFVTKNGIVKRTSVDEFRHINKNGKIAIDLRENDLLFFVKPTTGQEEVIIAASNGKAVRFKETDIRMMGRTAAGVRGMDVGSDHVVGCAVSHEGDTLLSISENGYGKRSQIDDYRLTSRGKKGVSTMNITEKTGNLMVAKAVNPEQDAMIVSSSGIMIRIPIDSIGIYGRNTQGVRLINLTENAKVTRLTLVDHQEEEQEPEEEQEYR
ncbi:DNA gyrase subunit A [Catenisphaera adipataccumulans]|jgi:DNA gyrase subunit A|uniref:DNA gyrase subunit A n=1 Tax=Catenisphaera adipataccumulans TaxID=700500 RepID=A0A7W8D0N5_9FIRM|nr:DNA gyrase subunit A [Catenisphaera adipataccumulans]MBB5183842.1 DNA gyrase subunit A [Catenisphaera adipataccumulans]